MRRDEITKQNPIEIICALIFILGTTSLAIEALTSICNRINFVLGMIVLIALFMKKRTQAIVFFMSIISLALGVVNTFVVHQQAFQNYMITSLIYFPVAVYLAYERKPNKYIWNSVVIYVFVITMYYWISTPDGYMLFYATGRNYVSVYLLEVVSIACIVYTKNSIELPLVLYIVFFVCCISAVGRMGILVSGGLLVAVFYVRTFRRPDLDKDKKVLRVGLVFIVLLVGLYFIFRYQDVIMSKLFSRFMKDQVTSDSDMSRIGILQSYISQILSVKGFVFGANTHQIEYLEQWNGNVHNTYLMIHAAYGVLGISFMLVSILKSLYYLHKEKKHELFFVILFFAIRCLTDNVLNGQPGDVIAWVIILLPIIYHRKRKNSLRFLYE